MRGEIRKLEGMGGGQSDDAQAAILAMLSGLTEGTVKSILSVGIALVAELGAAFGLYLAAGWASSEPTGRRQGAETVNGHQYNAPRTWIKPNRRDEEDDYWEADAVRPSKDLPCLRGLSGSPSCGAYKAA